MRVKNCDGCGILVSTHDQTDIFEMTLVHKHNSKENGKKAFTNWFDFCSKKCMIDYLSKTFGVIPNNEFYGGIYE
jgi:hypothetical protein